MEKIVAYLASPVHGRWPHHGRLARYLLRLVCRELKRWGYIENFSTLHSGIFRFPHDLPLVMHQSQVARNFFGPLDLQQIVAEWEILKKNHEFYHALGDATFHGEGYIITRLVGPYGYTNVGTPKDLPWYLREFADMHGLSFAIVAPQEAVKLDEKRRQK